MVLHIIVRSSWKLFRDVCPSVSVVLMHGNQDGFFIVGPFALFKLWVQVIHETFSALFSLSSRKMGSDLGPFASIQMALLSKNLILLCGP